jgi:peptide/nickel transport system substrate-binding protein
MAVAQLIADDMLNNCGVQLNQEFWNPGEFFADGPDGPLFGRRFELGTFAWLTGVHQPRCDLYITNQIPGPFENGFPSGWGGSNNSGYSNLLYDAACKAALMLLTNAENEANHKEAIRIFTEELPVLPLYLRLRTGTASPHITGFELDGTEVPLWNIEEISQNLETTNIPIYLPVIINQ